MDSILQELLNTTINNWELMGLLVIPGLLVGLRRGWQEEGFTSIALGVIVSGLGQRFGEFLILIANRVVSVIPMGVAIVQNKPPEQWPSLGDQVIPPDNLWAQLVAFALMVLVAYRAGTILGRRQGVGIPGKFAGGIFGAINTILILARVFAITKPLEEGVTVEVPTITVLGLRADQLNNLIVGLIAFIFALFLLLAWMQRRRGAA
jgi:hypothetical protein